MAHIRPATPADAPLLAELRGVMQRGNGVGEEQIARDLATWQAWFAAVLASGEYVAWVAEQGGQSAGTVGLLFFPQIPSATDPHTRRPQVVNVAVRRPNSGGVDWQESCSAARWRGRRPRATNSSASTRPRWARSSTAAPDSRKTPIRR